MEKFRDSWQQCFPPAPTFTGKSLSRQDGRVFIVTGGNSGIGLALIKLLYPTGAKIYMASRSKERAEAAIASVIDEATAGNGGKPVEGAGTITFMPLDLNDLTTIKSSVAFFASRESRLDILWNNAGIAGAPVGTKTAQGLEGHTGTNCVAPLLLTQELAPLLRNAAASSPPGATRVVWTGSLSIESFSPPGGVDISLLDRLNGDAKGTQDSPRDYGMSKTGNWFLAVEGARRWGSETAPGKGDALVSVAENPGQIDTAAYKHQSKLMMKFIRPTMYPPKMGAYTMLFAGLSPDIGLKQNGAYVLPFGRLQTKSTRRDIVKAIEDGKAQEYWTWCENIYKSYI
ncbi:NAD(P)-binding protein [Hypoxylon rubiginosum]|uniref:NAD(P)-binding protein n=1 Tax=Hypoxylon rubiginosum TaxID=110542 RepID=A0ACC0CUL9_9PEZI|nr:NAD(P)-binding protein [Hypoxylon rubiginosum]